MTATALHGSGQETLVDLEGSFSAGPHTFGVQFVNDAYGGSSSEDRNLYVDAVSVDGVDQGFSQALFTNSTATLQAQAATIVGSGSDTIEVVAASTACRAAARLR